MPDEKIYLVVKTLHWGDDVIYVCATQETAMKKLLDIYEGVAKYCKTNLDAAKRVKKGIRHTTDRMLECYWAHQEKTTKAMYDIVETKLYR